MTIRPWADGNGRTTRLVMNMIQRQLGLVPSIVTSDKKGEYINALIQTRENGDMSIIEDGMLKQHITNLENRIAQYESSIDDTINDTINHLGDMINDTSTSRQKEILRLVKRLPGTTRILLASETGVSVATIARDIAVLLDKKLIERVGGKKSGYRSHL